MVCWLVIRSNTRDVDQMRAFLCPVPGSHERTVIFDVLAVFSTAKTNLRRAKTSLRRTKTILRRAINKTKIRRAKTLSLIHI